SRVTPNPAVISTRAVTATMAPTEPDATAAMPAARITTPAPPAGTTVRRCRHSRRRGGRNLGGMILLSVRRRVGFTRTSQPLGSVGRGRSAGVEELLGEFGQLVGVVDAVVLHQDDQVGRGTG